MMLRDDLRKRPDLGLRKTVAHHLLEPPNHFDPNSARRPQRWFVLFSIVSLAAVGAVVYFNSWN
ncbi:MAG: hypothetical protein WCC22_00285 [Terriglobales bacterium]